MAYSIGQVSATELALRAADKPLLATQSIPTAPTVAIWTRNGNATDADESETGYPASRAFDGYAHLPTRPDQGGTPTDTWYLVFQFPSPGIEFDLCSFVGENSKLITGVGGICRIEIANNAAFSSGLFVDTLFNGPQSDSRFIELDLNLSLINTRVSNCEFVRIRFDNNGTNFEPEVGEVIIGRQRQLKHKPRTPYDDTGELNGDFADAVTAGGVRHRFSYNAGRRRLEAALNPAEEPYLSDLPAWFRETEYGAEPFIWIENPGTADADFNWLQLEDPSFSFPVIDFVERQLTITANEQGPERFYLERE